MKFERKLALGLLSASAWAMAAPAFAQTTVQLGVGAEYSSGAYGGTEDVRIIETPFSLRVKTGNWSFRARIPFASIDGGTGVTPGSDDIGSEDRCRSSNSGSGSSGSSGSGSGSRTCVPVAAAPSPLPFVAAEDRQGLGDLSLSAAYTFAFSEEMYADLTGRVTLPTGEEEKDLGTGETDYSLGLEVGRDTDAGGLYAGGGYRIRGGTGREDGPFASVGGYGLFGKSMIVGAEVGWSQASRDLVDDPASVTGYVSFNAMKNLRVSTFVETGLSDNAPDIAAGVSLAWRPNFRRPFQSN